MSVNNPFNKTIHNSENYSRLFLRDEELQLGIATIFEAAAFLKSIAEPELIKFGLSWAQLKLIITLGAKGDSVLNLASRLAITKQALTKIIRSLEMRNLIIRKTDERDNRRKLLELTQSGKDLEFEICKKMRIIIARAYRKTGADAVLGADKVMWAILGTDSTIKNRDFEE